MVERRIAGEASWVSSKPVLRHAAMVLALAALPLAAGAETAPDALPPAASGGNAAPDNAPVGAPVAVDQAVLDAVMLALDLPSRAESLAAAGFSETEGMGNDLLPKGADAQWLARMRAIHDADLHLTRLQAALEQALREEPGHLAAMAAFLASPLGARANQLQVAAEGRLIDGEAMEAALVAFERRSETRDPHPGQLRRLMEKGALLQATLAAELSAHLAFDEGRDAMLPALRRTGPEGLRAAVRSREPELRAQVEDRLLARLLAAWGDLAPAEIEAVVAFHLTPAGRALDAALERAMDAALTPAARATGEALAARLLGREI